MLSQKSKRHVAVLQDKNAGDVSQLNFTEYRWYLLNSPSPSTTGESYCMPIHTFKGTTVMHNVSSR